MYYKPKKEQLEFLNWELGCFFHFGIRTFYEGHRDWDGKEMPLEGFNPTDLSCESWMETVRDAGAKYAILVCKHHDGFANWPSAYTKYSVAGTPWKAGKGDVVREFTDACRKYGIKVGLYYSPAEAGFVKKKPEEYDEYFISQVSELLSNYGKIDYLWFDGCGSENHKYDTERIVKVIRSLQPEILLFNMWDPDTRWVGNESGQAHLSNDLFVNKTSFSVMIEAGDKEKLDKTMFLPAECDFRMRISNWFYSDNDIDTVKSVDELIGNYYYSVGRGSNMLINIGPDRRGRLPEKDAETLVAFGKRVKEMFASPICSEFKSSGDSYVIEMDKPKLVNNVVISECECALDAVKDFEIKAYPFEYGLPITIYVGKTIGHKAICSFPAFYSRKFELIVNKKAYDASISKMEIHYIK